MTPAVKNSAAQILPTCHTLDDADICLSKVRPKLSRAMRWGLFDGYVGWRPPSTDGLALGQLIPPQEMLLDYNEGREIGREISMRKEPG